MRGAGLPVFRSPRASIRLRGPRFSRQCCPPASLPALAGETDPSPPHCALSGPYKKKEWICSFPSPPTERGWLQRLMYTPRLSAMHCAIAGDLESEPR